MPENIQKNRITREIVSEEWGNYTNLVQEETYSIGEYTVNVGQKTTLKVEKPAYFIVVSGAAEFNSGGKKKKASKGDKICIANPVLNSIVKNCGVIPLVIIEVSYSTSLPNLRKI